MSSPAPVSLAGNDAVALTYRLPSEIRVRAEGVGALNWRAGQGPFGQTTIASRNGTVSTVQWRPNVLTPDECAALVAAARALPGLPGVDGRPGPAYGSAGSSHVTWLEPDEEHHWIYHKVGALFAEINRQYAFDVVGMVEALQFTEHGPGEPPHWQLDIAAEQASLRKLSMIIQLSDPHGYDGGEHEFVALDPVAEGREQGSAMVFPSFLGHRARPIARGTRCSLVAWAAGQPFR